MIEGDDATIAADDVMLHVEDHGGDVVLGHVSGSGSGSASPVNLVPDIAVNLVIEDVPNVGFKSGNDSGHLVSMSHGMDGNDRVLSDGGDGEDTFRHGEGNEFRAYIIDWDKVNPGWYGHDPARDPGSIILMRSGGRFLANFPLGMTYEWDSYLAFFVTDHYMYRRRHQMIVDSESWLVSSLTTGWLLL